MSEEEKIQVEHIKESPTYREIMLLRIIDKLQKENEELQKCLEAEEKYSEGLNRDIKSLLSIEPNTNYISKDKIRTKIKELEEMEVYGVLFETGVNFAIRVLKELLGE